MASGVVLGRLMPWYIRVAICGSKAMPFGRLKGLASIVPAGAGAAIVLAALTVAAAADDRGDCATGGPALRVAACTRLLQAAPADVNALGNRGVAYRLLGRYDEALADLDKALRINPDSAGLYLERGLVRDAAGDHDHAVADFSAAIARNATLVQAWFGRAMAYDAAGHHDLAAKDLATAVQRNRTMVAALYMERGYALHERRQFAGARAAFDQAIALGPGWLSAYCGRAASYEETGDADRAVADYKKCLALKATTALEIERQQAARERLARLERR